MHSECTSCIHDIWTSSPPRCNRSMALRPRVELLGLSRAGTRRSILILKNNYTWTFVHRPASSAENKWSVHARPFLQLSLPTSHLSLSLTHTHAHAHPNLTHTGRIPTIPTINLVEGLSRTGRMQMKSL